LKLEPIIQITPAWTAISGRFGVHVFEGRLSIADMNRMQTIGDEWYRKNPGRLVELVIVYPSKALMTNEERKRMTLLIKRWERHRDASATVILAEGLLGAMQRSVLTGMLMIVPPPHPSKIFSGITDAVTWLYPHIAPLCPEAGTRDVAVAAVNELCREFKCRPEARDFLETTS
jgi:hypothetical protein